MRFVFNSREGIPARVGARKDSRTSDVRTSYVIPSRRPPPKNGFGSFRQGERNKGIPRLGPEFATAAGSDGDELPAVNGVRTRCRVAAGIQDDVPQKLAGVLIEGVE